MKLSSKDSARTVANHPFAFFRTVHESQGTWLSTDVYAKLSSIGGVTVRGAGVLHEMAYSVITTRETARVREIKDLDVDDLVEGVWKTVRSLQDARRQVKVADVETYFNRNNQARVVYVLDDKKLIQERHSVLEHLARVSGSPVETITGNNGLRKNPTPHVTAAYLDRSVSPDGHRQVLSILEDLALPYLDLNQARLYRANE